MIMTFSSSALLSILTTLTRRKRQKDLHESESIHAIFRPAKVMRAAARTVL
jgi:hypothetical protein